MTALEYFQLIAPEYSSTLEPEQPTAPAEVTMRQARLDSIS